jgi:hypothetical protein
MRRFFIVLFVLSLVATAAALYWRTYLPETAVPATAQERSLRPGAGEDSATGGTRSLRQYVSKPSNRQDLAVTISILSSIISAIAAVAQTWLTARAVRR